MRVRFSQAVTASHRLTWARWRLLPHHLHALHPPSAFSRGPHKIRRQIARPKRGVADHGGVAPTLPSLPTTYTGLFAAVSARQCAQRPGRVGKNLQVTVAAGFARSTHRTGKQPLVSGNAVSRTIRSAGRRWGSRKYFSLLLKPAVVMALATACISWVT